MNRYGEPFFCMKLLPASPKNRKEKPRSGFPRSRKVIFDALPCRYCAGLLKVKLL
jgi:hypothetical protein